MSGRGESWLYAYRRRHVIIAILLAIPIGTLRGIDAGLAVALVVGVIVCQLSLSRHRGHSRRK
jgi:hypothetical protein